MILVMHNNLKKKYYTTFIQDLFKQIYEKKKIFPLRPSPFLSL